MPLVCRNCGYSRPTSVGDPGAACPVCKAPYPEDDLAAFATEHANRSAWSSGVVVAAVVLVACAGVARMLIPPVENPPERRLSLKDEFAEAISVPWIEDSEWEVAHALGKITGCGRLRHKRIPGRTGVYLVECSDSHGQKTGYKVGLIDGFVLGPLHFSDAR